MATYWLKRLLLIITSSFTPYFFPFSLNRNLPLRAVNLGGWLVVEGPIKPSLFYGIPNKDFLDGTQLQLKSVKFGKYLCAENGGGTVIVANQTSASNWESFRLWRINETSFHFRVFNRQFVGVNGFKVVSSSNTSGRSETFQIVRKADDLNRIRIKAPSGFFLQVKTEELVTADFEGDSDWGDDDPSVFVMTIVKALQGEFQLTNGYGPVKAQQVMREHWETFIVEEDFKFISKNGLNAVQIPVGWWIKSDPTPPKPYIGGSLQALDNAFSWAKKYGLKVIINLHAAPGGQNEFDHCSSRDGFLDWGANDKNIQDTVAVIDYLSARYANHPSLVGVGLLNEPRPSGVTLERLLKFYRAGYDAVRKHSSIAYVMMSSRLGADAEELIPLASELKDSVIDIHCYNLFFFGFDYFSVQDNIDFIYNRQANLLNNITKRNGPLTFVGEWVDEWQAKGATKEEYQRYANAQVEVYGRATFGWAYWTLKHSQNHWSMEWMIKNNYIKI